MKANSFGSGNTLIFNKNTKHFGIFKWVDLSHILVLGSLPPNDALKMGKGTLFPYPPKNLL